MEEKEITIKLSVLMERFKESTTNPLHLLMAKLDPFWFAIHLVLDLFPEYADDTREFVRIKASGEDAQNRSN